jgi:hypothetical protein
MQCDGSRCKTLKYVHRLFATAILLRQKEPWKSELPIFSHGFQGNRGLKERCDPEGENKLQIADISSLFVTILNFYFRNCTASETLTAILFMRLSLSHIRS